MGNIWGHGQDPLKSGFKIVALALFVSLPHESVLLASRFVQIGHVCRKAAHYVRYQTPKGSD